MPVKRRPRFEPRRDPDYTIFETLGFVLGRVAIANAVRRHAITTGYTRAMHEHNAGGRARTAAELAEQLQRAHDEIAAAHPPPAKKTRRRR